MKAYRKKFKKKKMGPLKVINTLKKAKIVDSVLLSLYINSNVICNIADAS